MQLYNIRVEALQNIFNQNSQGFFIRFLHNNQIFKSDKPSTFINENTIQWQEVFKASLVKQQFLDFQIYKEPDLFDYNPKQEVLYSGMIWLRQDRTFGKWDIYKTKIQEKNKVGVLALNFDFIQEQNKQENKIQEEENQEVEETSIKIDLEVIIKNLARVPQKGYITLQNGVRSLVGPILKPMKNNNIGQFRYLLRFSESFLKRAKNNELSIYFYESDNQYVGEAKFQLKENKKIMGAWILNEQQVRVGDAYINFITQRQKLKKQFALDTVDPKQKIILDYQESKYQQKTFQIKQQELIQKQLKPQTPKISEKEEKDQNSKQIYLYQKSTRKNPRQILSKGKKKTQPPRVSRSYKQIYSGIDKIAFISSQRFKSREKKRTNILQKVESPKLKGSYRAHCVKCASLGKNDNNHKDHKGESTQKSPGMSSYKLPSIFDRH